MSVMRFGWWFVAMALLGLACIGLGGCAPVDTGNPSCLQGCTVQVGGV